MERKQTAEKNLQVNSGLTTQEQSRFNRQIIMPEIGLEGQEKLKNSKVLIIGAGGLGSPVALYLAAAGIGTIGIVDNDRVDISNLQRQIIHGESMEGIKKAESAKQSMKRLNGNVNVETYMCRITPENISGIIEKYDFVIDAVDNFETKFLINDACVIAKKPFCHGGVIRFNGQVMTYVPGQGACYRCVFEEIPKRGSSPKCYTVGVLGTVVGIIGCIQATEAVKYLTGAGELLTGRMLIVDGLTMNIRTAKFGNGVKSCRVCGDKPDITDVYANRKEYCL